MKPKLLVIELWGMGDLVLATPFLKAASRIYEVALLAKPTALQLQPRLWPEVEVIPFSFPWTAFSGKYQLHRWPWRDMSGVVRQLRARHFDVGVSARWDPRDHFLLWLAGARRRVGFPRVGSGLLLTQSPAQPQATSHRYEFWRVLAREVELELPWPAPIVSVTGRRTIVLHSGAAHPFRVWPLERVRALTQRLRQSGHVVRLVCDPAQSPWWKAQGEEVYVPGNIQELTAILDEAALFIGNDSGPGHLAGVLGIPTFTIFGDNLPSRFAPLHPKAEWIDGKDCPFKPCSDMCHFAQPNCLLDVSEQEVWEKVRAFAAKHLPANAIVASTSAH